MEIKDLVAKLEQSQSALKASQQKLLLQYKNVDTDKSKIEVWLLYVSLKHLFLYKERKCDLG